MKRTKTGDFYFRNFKDILGIEVVYAKHVTHDFSRHTHRTLCIGIIEQGERCLICRGTRYNVTPGQVFVIPPNEAHSCGPATESHTYRLLIVSPNVWHSILPKSENSCNSQYIFAKLVIEDKELFGQLLNFHLILETSESAFVKQSLLFSAVGNTIEQCVDIPDRMKIGHDHHECVKHAQLFIEDHYGENFSLYELAQRVYLSPYYLIRVFSQIVGISPHIYQQQVRIRHAKTLLLQGISLVEIAHQTGFTDQSHFSNVFKKMVGVTPGEYTTS